MAREARRLSDGKQTERIERREAWTKRVDWPVREAVDGQAPSEQDGEREYRQEEGEEVAAVTSSGRARDFGTSRPSLERAARTQRPLPVASKARRASRCRE